MHKGDEILNRNEAKHTISYLRSPKGHQLVLYLRERKKQVTVFDHETEVFIPSILASGRKNLTLERGHNMQ